MITDGDVGSFAIVAPASPCATIEGSAAMSHAQDQSARDARTEAAAGTTTGTSVPRPAQSYDDTSYAEARPTGAALGLTITAAVLMMVSGLWSFLEGLAAIIRGQFFVVLPNYVYSISVTSWGWIHLIVGALIFVAGAFLFMDKMWARVVGVALACISAVVNFLYIPYSPVWSVVVIALDVFIVWALLSPRNQRETG
jgi:hypothetical protein